MRTRTVGHVRDVRRLVVAMSRARLGLYVFCRQKLFENCYELTPTFAQLLRKPNHLQLVPGERWKPLDKRTVSSGEGNENGEAEAREKRGGEPQPSHTGAARINSGERLAITEAPVPVINVRDVAEMGALVHRMATQNLSSLPLN